MSKYDFDEDEEQGSDLNDIAKKLSQAKTSKDALIKLLKVQVSSCQRVVPILLLTLAGHI